MPNINKLFKNFRESSRLISYKMNKVNSSVKINKKTPVQPLTFMVSRQAVVNCDALF